MDTKTFISNLRRSGLVPKEELEKILLKVPVAERAKTVARALVKMEILTKFQAQLLLAGRSSGFVLGQYRILDELGQGGMGHVYKAQHITMGRTVALKVLAPRHTKTAKARDLFLREVQASGKLMHPNIVTSHDANQVDGRHYLVMEYIDGPNLDQVVRERGPLPVGMACDLVRQVASALQCAHEQGMVHRDIKPSNMLLQRAGTALSSGYVVKIVDFGLACLAETTANPEPGKNVVIGTPDYLSPEQACNQRGVDIRSDLYSLGCTFYFLLTGQVPFPGGTPFEKLMRQANDEPTDIEQLRPDVPQEVADILRCLMAKAPAHRYQTPAQLVLDLMPLAQPVPSAWASIKKLPMPGSDTVELESNTGSAPAVDAAKVSTAGAGADTAAIVATREGKSGLAAGKKPQPGSKRDGTFWLTITLGILAGCVIGAAATVGLVFLLR
jgi:serine/threonine protein kinase